jgi:hypothetical protein
MIDAGSGARIEAERSRREAEAHRRAADQAERRAYGFGVAARTEPLTAQALESLIPHGYVILHDRRWPGTRRANLDHLLVGPGGVFVVDTKSWRGEVSVTSQSLYQDQACRDDEVAKAVDQAQAVESVLVDVGLAPLEVVPVLCFVQQRELRGAIGRVRLVSLAELQRLVLRRGPRLNPVQCRAVLEQLDTMCPHAPGDVRPRPTESAPVIPRVVVPHREESFADTLFSTEQLHREAVEAAAQGSIEPWMTFLHPDQARLVRKSFSGPCRFRGPAGTGKTVVALHRMAYLASTRPGRLLFTSYVRTLPTVMQALYRQLAPTTVDRVEFTNLHSWALRRLRDEGTEVQLDGDKAESAFWYAFKDWSGRSSLVTGSTPVSYWKAEIDYVVKGRGLTQFGEYADLRRVGRRARLTIEQRATVWELYERYNAILRDRGIVDFNDVLTLALDRTRREPETDYAAVIVDEVQDLNLLGVQLLHAVVGDQPDGLTLVGDGQQAIYPGGYTLAEAAISVAGRASVLKMNYRNTAAILDFATSLVADDEFEDLGAEIEQGRREVTVVRTGGTDPVRYQAPDLAAHDAELVEGVRRAGVLVGLGNVAILAPTNRVVGHYRKVLREAGIHAVSLENYDGVPSDSVKIGTFKRAKGLEFASVFLPLAELPVVGDLDDPADLERHALERREHYVAMTRARDLLWVGHVEEGPPGR